MILRRWKPTLIAFLAILLSFSGFATIVAPNQAVAAVQTTLYASPTGSGTVCRQASPCSLEGARDQARTINGNMTGDIIIRLLDGTYTLSSTFQLTESETVHDSGTNGYNVIYQADPGSHPVISGGQQITGWTQYDSVKNIYRANVGTSLNTRQLYVNGVRATRARGALNPPGWSVMSNGFFAPDSTMASWGNQSNIEVVSNVAWRSYRCGVSSISGTSVTMQHPCWANGKSFGSNKMGNPAWIENAYELLDSEGEWYLDRTAGYLYYKPLANENISTATVVAPVLEKLVNAAGTYATPLHNVQFYGITFAYATWLRTSTGEGYIPGQSGELRFGTQGGSGNEIKTPSNVTFSAVKNVRLERNTFAHLGAAAMSFEYGCQNNTVIGNVFQDISSSAIWMGDPFDQGHNVSAFYNNNDSAITYSGSFSSSYNYNSSNYQGDVRQTQNNNDYFEFTFTGSGVNYYGTSDTTTGTQDVYIDGTFQQTIDGYYANGSLVKLLYTNPGLSYGQHTIKVVKTGGSWMRLDMLGVYAEADPTVKTIKNNTIKNNYIAQAGVEYMDAPGINVLFTDGTNISHNEITDVPYDGISIGWGWGVPDPGSTNFGWTTPSVAQNNTVQYNYIHDVMNVLHDGGGVYTLSSQPNSSINNNYFRDDFAPAGAIYLDEQTQGFNVNNNLVANIGNNVNWLYVQNYHPNSVSRNNTIYSNYGSSVKKTGDWTKNTYNSDNQDGLTSNDVFPLQPYNIALNSGIEDSYRDIIPQSNFSLPDYLLLASVYVDTNALTIPIRSAGDATKTVWLAPSGTTTFAEGNTMTKAGGTATSISVPKAAGDYKLYVVDALGNRSAESRFLVRQQWNYVDDKNASVTYSPAWGNWNDSRDYNGSESFINSANSYAEYTFNGTGVRYLSMTQANMGKVDVYIDGVLAQADIDAYALNMTKQVLLYQNTNLLNGSHTIKVVCKGTKNAASSDTVCALDAFASISAPDQTAYYKLVNKNSGKVMSVNGSSMDSGANIIQSNDISGFNQHWQIVKTASGDYKIINKNSGKVLDISGGSTSTGANLVQWDDTNASSQHWQLIDVGTGNGYFKIKNTNSTYLADVTGSSTTAGAQIIQSSDTGVNSQQWQLVKVDFGNKGDTLLKAQLQFDEPYGTTAIDTTGNGWHSTLVGGANRVAGESGSAVDLSGTNQYVALPSGVVSNNDTITIAAWVNLDTVSNWTRIFDFGSGSATNMFLTPKNGANSKIRFGIKNNGSAEQIIDGQAALPTGGWHHVAVTLNGSTGILYVDGAQVGSNTGMTLKPSTLGATSQNWIGRSQYASDPYLDGRVDDFRIYNRALTATEVTHVMNGQTKLPIAELPFNETSGTTANDVSGKGWNGTLMGGTTWATGNSGNAVDLDGTNSYVALPAGVVSGAATATVTAWVYQDTVSTWSRIFDLGTGGNTYMFLTPKAGGTNKIRFAIKLNGSSEQIINGTAALPTGGWHHVAVTLNGSTGTLYVDGQIVGSNSGMTIKPSDLGVTTQNWIGRSQFPDPYLNGRVDDFRIYDRALSAPEVLGVMNGG